MNLGRWTPLTFIFPSRYLDRATTGGEFDLHRWARKDYEWNQDPWNGFRDFAQPPSETISAGRGDCEDFALVAASWAVANNRAGVGLGVCFESTRPWPTHMIAYDSESVYSSGRISHESVDEWVEDSKYSFVLRRRVG